MRFDLEEAQKNYLGKVLSAVKRTPPDDAKNFRMLLPPPNVTGHLHLGHGLTATIEDVVARQKRLQGCKVEWIPGFGHDGIDSESVVERELWKKEGLRRVDLPGRSFLDKCHTFSSQNSKVIRNQLMLMGATLDWSKKYYSMDSVFSTAVHEAFSRLHNDGLIKNTKQTGSSRSEWCLDTTVLHQNALKCIAENKIKIEPEGQKQRLVDWLSNVEPWCLSRQLEWGHRIPAYKMRNMGTTAENSDWHIAHSAELAARYFDCKESDLVAETDVLDTWFSSALVPLVTAGWCRDATQMDPTRFTEPMTDLIVTSSNEMLGIWVARMIALTIHLTMGTVPFHRVFLHGLVIDAEGSKMSKSLSNVIDPLDVIGGIALDEMLQRIEESDLNKVSKAVAQQNMKAAFPNGLTGAGTDALRFALLRPDLGAADVPIAISQLIDEGLKFLHEVTARLDRCKTFLDGTVAAGSADLKKNRNETDNWLLSRYHRTMDTVAKSIDRMELNQAFQQLHEFLLTDLCDVYLATAQHAAPRVDKKRLAQIRSTFGHVIAGGLAQLSVFMPFASEVIYRKMHQRLHPQHLNGYIYEKPETPPLQTLEERGQLTLAVCRAVCDRREILDYCTRTIVKNDDKITLLQDIMAAKTGFDDTIYEPFPHNRSDRVPLRVEGPVNFFLQIQENRMRLYQEFLDEMVPQLDW